MAYRSGKGGDLLLGQIVSTCLRAAIGGGGGRQQPVRILG